MVIHLKCVLLVRRAGHWGGVLHQGAEAGSQAGTGWLGHITQKRGSWTLATLLPHLSPPLRNEGLDGEESLELLQGPAEGTGAGSKAWKGKWTAASKGHGQGTARQNDNSSFSFPGFYLPVIILIFMYIYIYTFVFL